MPIGGPTLLPWQRPVAAGVRIKQLQHSRVGDYLLQLGEERRTPEQRQVLICLPRELLAVPDKVPRTYSAEEQLKHHHSCGVNADWLASSESWQSEFAGRYRGEAAGDSARIEADLYKSHFLQAEEGSGEDCYQSLPFGLSSGLFSMPQQDGTSVAPRYPRPNASRRLPKGFAPAPWHSHWPPPAVASLIRGGGDIDASSIEQLRLRKSLQPPQLPLASVELSPDVARRRRREQLETHFGEALNEPLTAPPARSTFADAYGRDATVTHIRNVYDARRFLESEAAGEFRLNASDQSPSKRLVAPGAAAIICSDLKRSSWQPAELPASRGAAPSSTYRKDFQLQSYPRPFIQPPMGDSAPLPRIGGSAAAHIGGVSRDAHSGENFGSLALQKAENDREARAAAEFCFIGAAGRRAIRGGSSASSSSGRGRSVQRADFGDFGSRAYKRQPRFPERITYGGVAEAFQFGGPVDQQQQQQQPDE